MARPSDFSQEVVTLICERMQEGETLAQICRDPELPDRRTVYRWLDAHEAFRLAYARARIALMEFYSDQIIDVSWDAGSDTIKGAGDAPDKCNHEWIARSRLKVDTMKFLMSKINPRRYGDRLTLEPGDTGEPLPQLLRIERVIIDNNPAPLPPPAPPPAQLAYDPGPIPSRMQAEILSRFVTILREHVPNADQRDPRELIDESMHVFDRAMRAKYVPDCF